MLFWDYIKFIYSNSDEKCSIFCWYINRLPIFMKTNTCHIWSNNKRQKSRTLKMRRTSNWLIECIICISKLAQCNRSRFFMTNWILMQFFFVSFVHVLTIPRIACIAFETLQLWCQISCIIILKIIFNVRMFGSKSVFFQLRFFLLLRCAFVPM